MSQLQEVLWKDEACELPRKVVTDVYTGYTDFVRRYISRDIVMTLGLDATSDPAHMLLSRLGSLEIVNESSIIRVAWATTGQEYTQLAVKLSSLVTQARSIYYKRLDDSLQAMGLAEILWQPGEESNVLVARKNEEMEHQLIQRAHRHGNKATYIDSYDVLEECMNSGFQMVIYGHYLERGTAAVSASIEDITSSFPVAIDVGTDKPRDSSQAYELLKHRDDEFKHARYQLLPTPDKPGVGFEMLSAIVHTVGSAHALLKHPERLIESGLDQYLIPIDFRYE